MKIPVEAVEAAARAYAVADNMRAALTAAVPHMGQDRPDQGMQDHLDSLAANLATALDRATRAEAALAALVAGVRELLSIVPTMASQEHVAARKSLHALLPTIDDEEVAG